MLHELNNLNLTSLHNCAFKYPGSNLIAQHKLAKLQSEDAFKFQ